MTKGSATLIKGINKYMKNREHTYSQIATALGYKSGQAVRNWVARGHVPEKVRSDLKQFLKRH